MRSLANSGNSNRIALTSSNRSKNFIDIFAGCGGLSLGFLRAGWQGLFAIEKDQNAFATLKFNLASETSRYQFVWPDWLPKTPHEVKDVLRKHRRQLTHLQGQVDAIVGGPPCQGFSTAGRRDPNDPRNKLVEAYLDFVELVQPSVVVLENVRGITADFKDSQSPTGSINYARWLISSLSRHYSVTSRTLDISLFGVPQKRFRFFVIAVRRDIATHLQGCPFETIDADRVSFLRNKGLFSTPIGAKRAISDLELSRNETFPSRDTNGFQDIGYKGPRTSYQRLMNAGTVGAPQDTRLARHNTEVENRFSALIELCNRDGHLNTSITAETRASFGLKKCAIRVMDPDLPAPTITSMPDDLIHYSEPRILTVRENARLQSFPDWFEFKGKYTTGGLRRRNEVPRFTQVANAVPPLLAEAIGLALMRYLSGYLSSSKSRALQTPLDEIAAHA
jgi:DNA (cytosine-5)-methyltransferase 1